MRTSLEENSKYIKLLTGLTNFYCGTQICSLIAMNILNFTYKTGKLEEKRGCFSSSDYKGNKNPQTERLEQNYVKSSMKQVTVAVVQFFPLLSSCATTSLAVMHNQPCKYI